MNYSNFLKYDAVSLLLVLLLSPALPYAGAQSPGFSQPEPYGNQFSPSMAIIIVVLIAALFFMGFFSIYIRHCSDGQNGPNSIAGAATGRSRRAARGIDAAVLETFPTLEYSTVKGLKIGKGALECAVCLCEFEDDETLRLIPKCDHVFHPECIDTWLESHTTCPVCRANLVPGPDESLHRPDLPTFDIEAQNDAVGIEPVVEDRTGEDDQLPQPAVPPVSEPEVVELNKTLNRNRTRGSRSSRIRRLFPRSHSTGHSLVQPGENTERFTLRLPAEVRKEIMNRQLQRASSLLVLPRDSSSRRGYRAGGDGSSRGGRFSRRPERLDRLTKSDRWVFPMGFFNRMSSMKSPKVAANDGEGSSSERVIEPDVPRSDSVRPPV